MKREVLNRRSVTYGMSPKLCYWCGIEHTQFLSQAQGSIVLHFHVPYPIVLIAPDLIINKILTLYFKCTFYNIYIIGT
jgi:hypothetical protein